MSKTKTKKVRKPKKKCYAIHWIDEKKDMIVTTWPECQKKIKGHNNMFKGFQSEEEAKKWLAGITRQKEKKHNEMVEKNKEIKRIKKSKVRYQFRLDKALSDKFQEKLKIMRLDVDAVIADFIREYVGED